MRLNRKWVVRYREWDRKESSWGPAIEKEFIDDDYRMFLEDAIHGDSIHISRASCVTSED